MNIHFTDETLFFQLMDSALFQVEVGSKMYGINNDNSDTDILVIYAESIENENSFMWTHHQLQYKKDNVDYMFTTIDKFIKNLINGDQTIFIEVAICDKMSDFNICDPSFSDYIHPMRWIQRMSQNGYFASYTTINAYLGLAKRDLKTVRSMIASNRIEVINDSFMKKLSHIARGIGMADGLYQRVVASTGYRYPFSAAVILASQLKSGEHIIFSDSISHDANGITVFDFSMLNRFIDNLEKKMIYIKNDINKMLENDLIPRFMTVNGLRNLDQELKRFMSSNYYKLKQRKTIDYGDIFYTALEKGVSYEKSNN